MKAAYIESYGNVEKMIVGELEKPSISSSQVLVKVAAAGVNPVDFHVRNGLLAESGTHSLPLVLGWDAAGIVSEVGEAVENLSVGDEVFVYSPIGEQGAYSEYLAVEAEFVAAKPKSLNFIESAAVPLAAVTAWQGLLQDGALEAGQRVLIHNASGGVGGFAVQIAKAFGAYVIATASAKKEKYVRSLGADEFIDYRSDAFEQRVKNVDLVFAATGGNDVLSRSLEVIKQGGRLVSTFDEMNEADALSKNVTYIRMWVRPDGDDLRHIAQMIDEGRIQVSIDSVYPLEDVKHALQRSENQLATGKIVLNLNSALFG